jgi:hypothetical protein
VGGKRRIAEVEGAEAGVPNLYTAAPFGSLTKGNELMIEYREVHQERAKAKYSKVRTPLASPVDSLD